MYFQENKTLFLLLAFLLFFCNSGKEKNPNDVTSDRSVSEGSALLSQWVDLVIQSHLECKYWTEMSSDIRPEQLRSHIDSISLTDLSPEIVYHLYDADIIEDSDICSYSEDVNMHKENKLQADYLQLLRVKCQVKPSLPEKDAVQLLSDDLTTEDLSSLGFRELLPVYLRYLEKATYYVDIYDLAQADKAFKICDGFTSDSVRASSLDLIKLQRKVRYYFGALEFDQAGNLLDSIMRRDIDSDYYSKRNLLLRINSLSILEPEKASEQILSDLKQLRGISKTTLDTAGYYEQYGNYLYMLGRTDEAIDNFNKAIDLYDKINHHEFLSYLYRILNFIYLGKGDYHTCNRMLIKEIRHYLEDTTINAPADVGLEDLAHIQTLDSWGSYADNLYEIYKQTGDRSYLDLSINAFEKIYNSLPLAVEKLENNSKSDFLSYYESLLCLAVPPLYETYQKNPDRQALNNIFEFIEKGRANIHQSRSALRKCSEYGVPDNLCELENSLQRELLELTSLLNPSAADIAQQNRKMNELRDLSNIIRKDYPLYFRRRYAHYEESLKDLRELTSSEDLSVIEYVWYEDQYTGKAIRYGFFVNADTSYVIELNGISFRSEILLLDSLTQTRDFSSPLYKETVSQMRRALIEPFREDFSSDRIAVIPHYELYKVPFSLLDTSLVFSHASSAKSLIDVTQRKTTIEVPRYLGAAYDGNRTERSLRYSASEIKQAKERFKNSKVLGGSSLNKKNFLYEIEQADIIHLALHGEVDGEGRSLLRLGPEDNQTVRYAEIETSEIPNSLVIINACRGADSDKLNAEGLNAMSTSFLMAGATTVISSLWDTPDVSAQWIANRFMSYYQSGIDSADALHRAQKDYLEYQKDPFLRQPHFWAGFVCIGAG